jgi:hypothetical protein
MLLGNAIFREVEMGVEVAGCLGFFLLPRVDVVDLRLLKYLACRK